MGLVDAAIDIGNLQCSHSPSHIHTKYIRQHMQNMHSWLISASCFIVPTQEKLDTVFLSDYLM